MLDSQPLHCVMKSIQWQNIAYNSPKRWCFAKYSDQNTQSHICEIIHRLCLHQCDERAHNYNLQHWSSCHHGDSGKQLVQAQPNKWILFEDSGSIIALHIAFTILIITSDQIETNSRKFSTWWHHTTCKTVTYNWQDSWITRSQRIVARHTQQKIETSQNILRFA